MKRTLGLFLALPLVGAERSGGGQKDMTAFLWANFAILALALGWLARKHGGPFLAARAEAIRQGITEAEKAKADAALRISAVEQKLATLGPEIEKLKNDMRREQAAEVERVRGRNTAELEHIHDMARQEVESAFKSARLQLEAHAGKLALELAEAKIRSRMNPEAQRKLTREFAGSLS